MFRALYRQNVRVRRLALVYHSRSASQFDHLLETLDERCYYDVEAVKEAYIRSAMERFDMVVFAPSDREVSRLAIDCVCRAQIPMLILIDLGGKNEKRNLWQTRLASLYKKNGIPILIRPFPAIRLFQKIDQVHIDNIVHAPKGLPVFEAELEPFTAIENLHTSPLAVSTN